MKTGNWSKVEKVYLTENYQTMDYKDIARYLDRNPETVRNYIETVISPADKGELIENDPVQSIKKTLLWKELKTQFSPTELDKFMFHWHKITKQFGQDILATEEMQVVDYIRLELLGDRILSIQQKNLQEISDLEESFLAEKKKKSPNIDRLDILSDQIGMRRSAQTDTTKEYKDVFMQKSKLLDQMKATRDARIKHLSSSKQNIPDWVKMIMMDENKRKDMGIYMAKVRLAIEKEKERLGRYHTYQDNNIDIPVLMTDTLKDKTSEE